MKPSRVNRGRDYMSDLPLEVVLNIFQFTTSTFKSISCCRCVCKSWRDMLSGPYFKKLDLLVTKSRNPASILLGKLNSFSKKVWNFGLIQCRIGEEALSSMSSSSFPRNCCFDISQPGYEFSNRDCYVSTSCNGLLLWWTNLGTKKRLYISNPMTRKCMALPESPRIQHGYCGFGFSPKTDQYKVIRLPGQPQGEGRYYNYKRYDSPIISSYNAYVHTIGTKSWRCIENIPALCPSYGCVFLDHGTLNWVGFSDSIWSSTDNSKMIYSFDIETEQFKELVLLPFHDLDNERREIYRPFYAHNYNIQLGSFGDSLCIVRHDTNTEIWVLQKNHIWMKKVVMTPSIYRSSVLDDRTIYNYISVLGNGEMLFIKQNVRTLFRTLVSYDPINKKYKTPNFFLDFGIAHVPSLVSLKNVAAAATKE